MASPSVPHGAHAKKNPPLESRWPATIAIGFALALYLVLPSNLVIGPRWLLPVLEMAAAIPLALTNTDRRVRNSSRIRAITVVLIAGISAANLVSLVLLVRYLIHGGDVTGSALVRSAFAVWGTFVIAFSLWYWELDGGGPVSRHQDTEATRDFLFPQQASPDVFPDPWLPNFVDYLYLSFTNCTAFSPTDTMPLTTWAKLLMMVQSAAAFVTVALVAARAVNILN
ncbi:MAG TPA: DUF1345 domain-containing protein [Acidimicrobiales bacterium]